MAVDAKDAVAALRRAHDELGAFVQNLSSEDLGRPSGASEWTVAQVLSHLGSAAEIGHHTLTTGNADLGAAPAVWDRWNAMSPRQQADGFMAADERLVESYEALDDEELESKLIDVGFLPQPVHVGFLATMRLSEVGLHGWDINVAYDPRATVAGHIVPIVLEQLPLFAGFFAKPIGRSGVLAIETTDPARHYRLELGEEGASLTEGPAADATARASLAAEVWLRLTAGRLAADHTPEGVGVEGDISLDDLRRVFPGY
jgi:uncharacterized protein (TIGR03083 family)